VRDAGSAVKPFQIDYGWDVLGALRSASSGGDARQVQAAWQKQTATYPPGMLHMAIQDDWDTPCDLKEFGGLVGATAAATFNFTINGIPLIFNGMEIGSSYAGTNPHAPIEWSKPRPGFAQFYHGLIALRNSNPALQQGALTWLANTTPSQMLSYTRSSGATSFLVVINISNKPAAGRVELSPMTGWVLAWASHQREHAGLKAPASYKFQPKQFAVYKQE
jgi:glycosidase